MFLGRFLRWTSKGSNSKEGRNRPPLNPGLLKIEKLHHLDLSINQIVRQICMLLSSKLK